jgi:hypothetical protein
VPAARLSRPFQRSLTCVAGPSGNGLLLRADLHTLFDLNFLGIEPDTLTVRVHPSAQKEGYGG